MSDTTAPAAEPKRGTRAARSLLHPASAHEARGHFGEEDDDYERDRSRSPAAGTLAREDEHAVAGEAATPRLNGPPGQRALAALATSSAAPPGLSAIALPGAVNAGAIPPVVADTSMADPVCVCVCLLSA